MIIPRYIMKPAAHIQCAFLGDIISTIGNIFSSERQMDFQEDMSNTAHRREIRDLKAAGLNPILSAKYGGASTPLGAGFQMPTFGSSSHQMAAASSAKAQAEKAGKESQVLDTEVERAGIMNGILKKFPEVAIAHALAGSSTADKVAATVLNRGGKMAQEMLKNEEGNSAKSIDATSKKPLEIPIYYNRDTDSYIKKKGISKEENIEIDKEYLRQQHELKKRQYQRGN